MKTSDEPGAGVKTKIIATVGPASDSDDRLEQLVRAGVDIFRLNMAHGQPDWRDTVLERIRSVGRRLDAVIGILTDLSGPKIRLGPIAGGSVLCEVGQVFQFVSGDMEAQPNVLTTTFPDLVESLNLGDLVLLADGTVSMRVVEKGSGSAKCCVEQAGEIRTGGGVNLPGVELRVSALTEKDRSDLRWAVDRQVDFIGLSFVRRATDVKELREELNRLQSNAQIIAKIEKPQAVAALDEIIGESDAIMVARGDLGVEIDVARVPVVQKQIIERCQAAHVPVITATQMLESMRSNRMPTRAEATDVANAILDGSDAVMLSAETAMGQYPVETVATMSRIARESEPLVRARFGRLSGTFPSDRRIIQLEADTPRAHDNQPLDANLQMRSAIATESIVEATSRLADQVEAKLMVVATQSGRTALALSKQRGSTPIVGLSDKETTVRRMTLYWGVTPLRAPHFQDGNQLLKHITEWAATKRFLKKGDRIVLITSTHWTTAGHNVIMVHEMS